MGALTVLTSVPPAAHECGRAVEDLTAEHVEDHVELAAIFWTWQHGEGTLSIHSITTQRREAYYWATVFATFALGTALGDFTAMSIHMGYLASGIFFGFVILVPAVAWWRLGLTSIAAFWMAYVVTRPLGASFADYISKARNLSGIGFGDGPTAIVLAIAVLLLVLYLAVRRPDIQTPLSASTARVRFSSSTTDVSVMRSPELDFE